MPGPTVREPTLAEGLTREFLLHHGVCPKEHSADGTLVVAVAPDAFRNVLDDLVFLYEAPVQVEELPRSDVERLIERLATQGDRSVELSRADERGAFDDEHTTDVRDLANQPPVIRYVNLVVRDAYDAGASDIHLEARRGGLTVRYRIDGVLVPAPEPSADLHHAVVSRLKLLAELDIAERRRPQDGRIRVRLESRELDLRVSTVPTLFGESVVLRLLDQGGRPVELSALGMASETLATFQRLAGRPHGMVLVTGPTGSGKTTTLYAALTCRDGGNEKIIAVEDPVEYQLPHVTQVPVHRAAGVTFATALRSILRQDPDVILIGEMRDQETAEIAVQAAMTGHLVFSTLHTNDAIAAIPRLLDLGIPQYLVASTLGGVLAQRLVRRICPDCRVEHRLSAERLCSIADGAAREHTAVRGAGCKACRGTGYRGRLGIFELVVVTDALREAIAHGVPAAELRVIAKREGMVTIRADGWAKVETGLTTVEEVMRVAQE